MIKAQFFKYKFRLLGTIHFEQKNNKRIQISIIPLKSVTTTIVI